MITVGIDPGLSGALVALHQGQPIEWLPMPTTVHGKKTRVDGAEVARWLRDLHPDRHGLHVWIEDVHAMPAQGVASMFSFGHSAGVVAGVVAACGLPVTYVTPQAWKKQAGLIGSDKDAARSRAIGLWPGWADLAAKGKGQALADAALIARYGEDR